MAVQGGWSTRATGVYQAGVNISDKITLADRRRSHSHQENQLRVNPLHGPCRALRHNPPGVARELILRGVRAVLSRLVGRVPLTTWPALPVLIGKVRLRLRLAANEAELLEQRILKSSWVVDHQFALVDVDAQQRLLGVVWAHALAP
jgi:hypothetical protein